MFAKFVLGLVAAAAWSCCLWSANAADRVTVGIGGKTIIAYLPITIAEQKGFFRDAGLAVELNDFRGGPKAVEALVAGSAEITVAAFEYPLLMQPKGMDLSTIVLLTKSYGNVFGIRKSLAAQYRSPKDLKGLKVGVTSPGSMLAGVVGRIMAKDGLTLDDVAIIGLGAGPGAVALMKSGRVDAISHSDPVTSRLVWDGDIVLLVDARKPEGMNYIFGGEIAASAVLTTPSYIRNNERTVQAFVSAVVRALHWMQTATLDEIVDAVPPEYYTGNKADYRAMLADNMQIFSPDGLVHRDGAERTLKFLIANGTRGEASPEALAASYDNRFVEQANKVMKALK